MRERERERERDWERDTHTHSAKVREGHSYYQGQKLFVPISVIDLSGNPITREINIAV